MQDSGINDMASYVHMCHGEKLDCVLAILLDSHQFMFIGFNMYLMVFNGIYVPNHCKESNDGMNGHKPYTMF